MTGSSSGKVGATRSVKVPLDSFDLKILDVLQANARITNAKLALEVGLSESACFNRVKRLERDKVISKYHAIINSQAISSSITVYAHIILDHFKYATASRFEQVVASIEEIVQCDYVTGQYDYVLTVVARDIENYTAIMKYISEKHGGVGNFFSHVVMKPVKVQPMSASYLISERYYPQIWDEDR